MTEGSGILTWDRADELIDTDPIALRDEAMTSIEALKTHIRALDREVLDLRHAVREFIGDISRSAMGEPKSWKSYIALRKALDG